MKKLIILTLGITLLSGCTWREGKYNRLVLESKIMDKKIEIARKQKALDSIQGANIPRLTVDTLPISKFDKTDTTIVVRDTIVEIPPIKHIEIIRK